MGTVPSELVSLTMLTWLDLSANAFTGSLPSELGSLTALTTLVLSDDGHHRISKAVRALHILTSKLWKGRNEILHQKTLAQEVNIRTTVDSEIVALQREPDKLPIHDQHYCNIPIHDLLCKSPSFKRRWLYRVREARARFQTEARNQPRITTFLTQKSDRTRHHDTAAAPAPSAIPKTRRQTMTTQLLMTEFFRERAPNRRYPSSLPNASPPPPP